MTKLYLAELTIPCPDYKRPEVDQYRKIFAHKKDANLWTYKKFFNHFGYEYLREFFNNYLSDKGALSESHIDHFLEHIKNDIFTYLSDDYEIANELDEYIKRDYYMGDTFNCRLIKLVDGLEL